MNKLHVSEKHLQMVLEVIKKHIPNAKVWAYGSRVSGDCHAGSDLDLAVIGCTAKELMSLKTGFQDSNIPFLIDAMRWESIPDYFQDEIKEKYVVIK